jgi:circadian clock protein KaiC
MNLIEPIAGKAKTGIWGIDYILSGGFSRGHVFLVEGAPGQAKPPSRCSS